LTRELKDLLNRYDGTFPDSTEPNLVKARVQIATVSDNIDERLQYRFRLSPGSIKLGPYDAPIQMVIFIDYQSPFSSKALRIARAVVQKFAGNIRLSIRYNLLAFHPCSKLMALGAIAAGRQEKFWAFSDMLISDDFLEQLHQIACRALLNNAAVAAGLDLSWFGRDLSDPSLARAVETDTETATLMGLGAPTFFLNGVIVPGAYPQEYFEALIYRLEPRLRTAKTATEERMTSYH